MRSESHGADQSQDLDLEQKISNAMKDGKRKAGEMKRRKADKLMSPSQRKREQLRRSKRRQAEDRKGRGGDR